MERIARQDEAEVQAGETAVVNGLLAKRDKQILKVLRAAKASKDVVQAMQEYLDEDRRAREPADAIAHRLALSPGSRSVLRYLLDRRLDELCRETKAVLQQVGEHSREREDLEHPLAATPAEDDIKKFVERLQEATGARARLEQRAKQLDADLGAKKLELTNCQTKLSRILESRLARKPRTKTASGCYGSPAARAKPWGSFWNGPHTRKSTASRP